MSIKKPTLTATMAKHIAAQGGAVPTVKTKVTLADLNAVTKAGQAYAAKRRVVRAISPELMSLPVTV
jgi:hypothetical protein